MNDDKFSPSSNNGKLINVGESSADQDSLIHICTRKRLTHISLKNCDDVVIAVSIAEPRGLNMG